MSLQKSAIKTAGHRQHMYVETPPSSMSRFWLCPDLATSDVAELLSSPQRAYFRSEGEWRREREGSIYVSTCIQRKLICISSNTSFLSLPMFHYSIAKNRLSDHLFLERFSVSLYINLVCVSFLRSCDSAWATVPDNMRLFFSPRQYFL